MSIMGVFFLFIYSVMGLYLWQQGILRSDWLKEGEIAFAPSSSNFPSLTPQKVGLLVFLSTAGCVFSLLIAAYFMRQGSPDWQLPEMPSILWFNYFLLVVSSCSIQAAYYSALKSRDTQLKSWLLVTGASSLLFLIGQMAAAYELQRLGVYTYGNPAASFFYLFTTLHACHLIGGLVALFRTIRKSNQQALGKLIAPSVELCAIYWHFLLFIWTLLFLLLLGKGDALGVICRRVLA